MTKKGKMDNKLVLVTGSGTGIGREIALEFAREGATVALHYAHSADGAESAVQEILSKGGKAKAFKAALYMLPLIFLKYQILRSRQWYIL